MYCDKGGVAILVGVFVAAVPANMLAGSKLGMRDDHYTL